MSASFEETKWYSYTSSSQTMRTWARQINSTEEIPEPFQAAFPKIEGSFPYTIFIPEEKVSKFHERNSKIIALFKDHFILWEQLDTEITALSSNFTDIFSVENGIILLKSWLKIETISGTFELSFNTSNDYLFNPLIDTLRQKMVQNQDEQSHKAQISKLNLSQFNFLNKINFKFMNYGRHCVQKHDSVLAVAYQPEQTIQDIQLFSKTLFRRYKTDFLITVTEEELILIQEDEPIRTNFSPAHGGVFTYISRHHIEDISFIAQSEDSNTLMEITLPNKTKVTCELAEENEALPILKELLGRTKTAVST